MTSLKRVRTGAGLSLRELAEKSGVDQATISRIENGHQKAYLVTLGRLATALGVPVETFLDLVETGASERGKRGAEARIARERDNKKEKE